MTNKNNSLEDSASINKNNLLHSLGKYLGVAQTASMELALKVISNEWTILEEHEDKAVYENRHKHFIEYHDDVVEKLQKMPYIAFYSFVQEQFGQDYIMNVFAKDKRTLIDLVIEIDNKYKLAVSYQQGSTIEPTFKSDTLSSGSRIKDVVKEIFGDEDSNTANKNEKSLTMAEMERNMELLRKMDKIVDLHLNGILSEEEAKSKISQLKKQLL